MTMGRHGGKPPSEPPDPANTEPWSPEDRLIHPAPWVDPEPSEPTNPDLWGTDPFYDPELSDRPRRTPALVAVALAVVVSALIGGIGWMFGTGTADTTPQTVYRTEQREATVTHTVSRPGKGKTSYRTTTARPALLPAPTVYVTSPARPAPVVTKTVKVATTVRATATVRVTKRVEVPGPVVTVTVEVQSQVNGDLPAE